MKISSLHVKDFIGLKELKCRDFSDINIFLGHNNAGKTSLLDALFFNSCTISDTSFRRVFRGRNISTRSVNDLRFFFYNQSYESKPSVEMEMHDENGKSFCKSEITNKKSHIEIKFSEQKHEDKGFQALGDCRIFFQDGNIDQRSSDFFTGFPLGVKYPNYINPEPEDMFINEPLLLDTRIRKEVDKTLRNIDPLFEYSSGYEHNIKMKNLDLEQSSNYFGRGFQIAIQLLWDMYSKEQNVLLVDEIEDGMYYQTIENVFDKICHIIEHEKYKKQLFITTHSYEVIRAIDTLMQQDEKYAKLFSVYTLRKYADGHRVFFHNQDSIRYAIEHNEELR